MSSPDLDDAHFERTVIQASLAWPEAFDIAYRRLEPSHFHLQPHAQAWEYMLAERACGRTPDRTAVWLRLHELHADQSISARLSDMSYLLDNWIGMDEQNTLVNAVLMAYSKRLRKSFANKVEASSNGGPPLDWQELLDCSYEIRTAEEMAVDTHEIPQHTHLGLMSVIDRPPDPIIGDGIICRGDLFLLGGKPSSGKSLLLQSMALCCSVGSPWLGLQTRSMRIGYLALEFQPGRLRQRIRALEAAGEPILERTIWWRDKYQVPGGLDLIGSKEDRASLVAWIRHNSLDLVIVDTLARACGGREETNEVLSQLVRRCDQVVAETNVALGFNHHLRKSPPGGNGRGMHEDSLDSIRGGGVLAAGFQVLMVVKKLGGGAGPRVIEFPKTNYSVEPAPMYFRVTPELGIEMVDAPEERAEDNRHLILRELIDLGRAASISEIRAVTGISDRTLRRHLERLVGEGKVQALGVTSDRKFIAQKTVSLATLATSAISPVAEDND